MAAWFDMLTNDLNPGEKRAVVLFTWRAAMAVFIAYALGLLSWIGFPGFAQAGDLLGLERKVTQLEVRATDIQTDLLETRIFSTRVSQCTATTADARQFYGGRLQELLRKYQEIQKSAYTLPSCDEVR